MREYIAALIFSLTSVTTAFTSTTFIGKVNIERNNGVISGRSVCACPTCSGFRQQLAAESVLSRRASMMLFMSDATAEEDVPAADVDGEDVPAEVAAMDGVDSEEEAHNSERPSRGSGIQKHKKPASAGKALSELEIGSSVEGRVKTITSYGAFLDIGAATDALLHVSRLSADFVSNVEDFLKAGDTVTVRIFSVDTDKNQIGITMLTAEEEANAKSRAQSSGGGDGKRKARPQRSQGDRQSQVETLRNLNDAGFDSDKFIEGEVVSALDFGAFVRFDASQLAEGVDGELDGLVHISSLCVGRAESVESIVSIGDKVQIRVKSVDVEGNRSALSMISADDEQSREGGKRKGGRQLFSDKEMGAKDWKESFEKFQDVQPTFSNSPIVLEKRK